MRYIDKHLMGIENGPIKARVSISYDTLLLGEKAREALYLLDDVGSTDWKFAADAVNTVGVFTGIKPTAVMQIPPAHARPIGEALQSLGIYAEPYTYRNITLISQDRDKIHQLHDAFYRANDNHAPGQRDTHLDEEAEREVGQLLGYPATATEHFIHRIKSGSTETDEVAKPDGDAAHFTWLVLSPDNVQEESAAYVIPIMEAAKVMLPETYAQITSPYVEKSLGRRSLGLLELFAKASQIFSRGR